MKTRRLIIILAVIAAGATAFWWDDVTVFFAGAPEAPSTSLPADDGSKRQRVGPQLDDQIGVAASAQLLLRDIQSAGKASMEALPDPVETVEKRTSGPDYLGVPFRNGEPMKIEYEGRRPVTTRWSPNKQIILASFGEFWVLFRENGTVRTRLPYVEAQPVGWRWLTDQSLLGEYTKSKPILPSPSGSESMISPPEQVFLFLYQFGDPDRVIEIQQLAVPPGEFIQVDAITTGGELILSSVPAELWGQGITGENPTAALMGLYRIKH